MDTPSLTRPRPVRHAPTRNTRTKAPGTEPDTGALQATRRSRAGAPPLLVDESTTSHPALLELRPYFRLIHRHRALILVVMLLCAAGSVVRTFLQPEVYLARATILPSGSQTAGGMLGFIASFTGSPPIGAVSEENSSFLFPRILESRSVGVEVLRDSYTFEVNGRPIQQTLFKYFEVETLDEGLEALGMIRSVDVDKETGIIKVAAQTPHPELSAQVANRLVSELEKANLEMRRTSAELNNDFIQRRLETTLVELGEAEERLTQFRENNVRINDPVLELERMRLERAVSLKSQVFMTLTNQAEIARIDLAKDLPVVRILDRATIPTEAVPTPRLSSLIIGLIAGVACSVLAVAGLEIAKYVWYEFKIVSQS